MTMQNLFQCKWKGPVSWRFRGTPVLTKPSHLCTKVLNCVLLEMLLISTLDASAPKCSEVGRHFLLSPLSLSACPLHLYRFSPLLHMVYLADTCLCSPHICFCKFGCSREAGDFWSCLFFIVLKSFDKRVSHNMLSSHGTQFSSQFLLTLRGEECRM